MKRIARYYNTSQDNDTFSTATTFIEAAMGPIIAVMSILLAFAYSDYLLPFFVPMALYGILLGIGPIIRRGRAGQSTLILAFYRIGNFISCIIFHALFSSYSSLILFSATTLGANVIVIRPNRIASRISLYVSIFLAIVICLFWNPIPIIQLPEDRHNELLQVVSYFLITMAVLFFSVVSFIFNASEKRIRLESSKAQNERDWALSTAKSRNELIAMMSHEYRTPLTTLVVASQNLIQRSGTGLYRSELLAINASSLHLLDLFNNALDYARYYDSRFYVQNAPVNLHELIFQVSQTLQPKLNAKSLSMTTSIDEDVPEYIQSDAALLRQLLLNLIENAIKYTDNGAIQIRATMKGSSKCLLAEISDNGPGIPPECQQSVFEPYRRTNSNDSSGTNGVGLGLAICTQIVKRLNGKIGVRNSQNGGAVFWFELPISVPSLMTEDLPTTLPLPVVENAKILLVEDHAFNRMILKEALENHGYEIATVENCHQALQLLRQTFFDIVLTDLHLSDGRGTELLVKARAHGIQTPFIALTASSSEEDLQECHAAGLSSVLTKPLSIADFKKAVSLALR